MLETVREYGEARLDAAGDRDRAMAGLVGWAGSRPSRSPPASSAPARSRRSTGAPPSRTTWSPACAGRSRTTTSRPRSTSPPRCSTSGRCGACTWRSSPGRAGCCTSTTRAARRAVGDPARRGRGRPLPDADRLAWTCLVIGVNAGISAALRPAVLARRALRTLLAERPGEVSPRLTALASALPGFDASDLEQSLTSADRDGRAPATRTCRGSACSPARRYGRTAACRRRRSATPSRRTTVRGGR